MLLANLTIPALPTSVVIGGLVTDATYSIRAAAWTLMDLGPPSPPTIHRIEALPLSTTKISPTLAPPPSKQPNANDSDSDSSGSLSNMTLMVQETWFILLLGGILLAILCLLVAALIVCRNLAKRKALSALSKADPDSAHCLRTKKLRLMHKLPFFHTPVQHLSKWQIDLWWRLQNTPNFWATAQTKSITT